jgi:hypothetical protein
LAGGVRRWALASTAKASRSSFGAKPLKTPGACRGHKPLCCSLLG